MFKKVFFGILFPLAVVYFYKNDWQTDTKQINTNQSSQNIAPKINKQKRQKFANTDKKNRKKSSSPLSKKQIETSAPHLEIIQDQSTKQTWSPEENIVRFTVENDWAIAFGDVLLGKVDPTKGIQNGNTIVKEPQQWENGVIPYYIKEDLKYPQRVIKAIEYFHDYTPIQFVPYQGQKDVLVFETGEENCYSYLGKIGGYQPIKLAENCAWTDILHEIMHAIGFVHEHSRTDREFYVKILWENIPDDYKMQFFIAPEAFMSPMHGTDFDPKSIMIYRSDAFARRKGLTTIMTINGEATKPTKTGLSEIDIERLYRLYGG